MLETLTLEALAKIDDGRVAELFRQHLVRIARDCHDRPADPTARKLILEIEVTPVLDPSTNCCDNVKTQIKAKSAVPIYKTRAYEMRMKPNGTLLYNEDSPEAVDQGTLFDGEQDS